MADTACWNTEGMSETGQMSLIETAFLVSHKLSKLIKGYTANFVCGLIFFLAQFKWEIV